MNTKPIKWTAADAGRAAKMGFSISNGHLSYRICRNGAVFATDREAAEWVAKTHWNPIMRGRGMEWKTCNKAVLLCLTGGAS